MNRHKWIQWLVFMGIIVLIAGCTKERGPAIDPPQFNYEEAGDVLAQTVSLNNTGQEQMMKITLFMKDAQGFVVPVSIEVPEDEGVAKLALKYMTMNGPLAYQLPHDFTPLIPEGTTVIGMDIIKDEKLAIVDFSKEFNQYAPEDERKILEAITWTLTEFPDVEQVKIWVNGYLLKEMPVGGLPIDEPLSRAMGINIERDKGVEISQSTPVTLYFQSYTSDQQEYYVPVTRLINRTDHVSIAAIEELIKGPSDASNLIPVLFPDVGVVKIQESEDVVSVYLTDHLLDGNSKAPEQSLKAVILSITENTGKSKVKIMVDNHAEVLSQEDVNYSQPVFRPMHYNQIVM